MRILFVCTGNTCRSPMAEALLKKRAPHLEVKSAGVYAAEGLNASSHAIKALEERNIDLNHYSQPVTGQLLKWADFVLTMTTQHKQLLIVNYPDEQDKYFTLKEFTADQDENTWEQVKATARKIEKKREHFIQENEKKYGDEELDMKLREHVQQDLDELYVLESSLDNYDVSDPFGGSLQTYRKTLSELNDSIERLIRKIAD